MRLVPKCLKYSPLHLQSRKLSIKFDIFNSVRVKAVSKTFVQVQTQVITDIRLIIHIKDKFMRVY